MSWTHPVSLMPRQPAGFKSDVQSEVANSQRVIAGAAAANGAPDSAAGATPSSSYHFSVGDVDAIDLFCAAPAAGTYDVRVHWFYKSSMKYTLDTIIGTVTVAAGTDKVFPILQGLKQATADGVYIEVLNFVGGATASIWAQGKRQTVTR